MRNDFNKPSRPSNLLFLFLSLFLKSHLIPLHFNACKLNREIFPVHWIERKKKFFFFTDKLFQLRDSLSIYGECEKNPKNFKIWYRILFE